MSRYERWRKVELSRRDDLGMPDEYFKADLSKKNHFISELLGYELSFELLEVNSENQHSFIELAHAYGNTDGTILTSLKDIARRKELYATKKESGFLSIVQARYDGFYKQEHNALYIETLKNLSESYPYIDERRGEIAVLGAVNAVSMRAKREKLEHVVIPMGKLVERTGILNTLMDDGWDGQIHDLDTGHLVLDVNDVKV